MLKKILKFIFKRKIVRNFKKFCPSKCGHALLYYKTDYFFLNGFLDDNSHINNWESFTIAKILNELGYYVDILDRTITLKDIDKLENKYDIFIGLGAGDSCRFYADIAQKMTKAIRIFYGLGIGPNLSVKLTQERHDLFIKRYPNSKIKVRRLVQHIDIYKSMKYTDVIITCCNDWGINSYKKFGKDIYRVYLSSYPTLNTSIQEINNKTKSFLYFGGNGNICKGLDLTIEAFAKLPYELYIGAPRTELDFNKIIDPIMTPNIHHLGFMDITGRKFKEITDKCAYVILPASSEGCATSVTTCMRRGLIPIVTEESGVDIGDFGYSIKTDDLERQIKEIYKNDFKQRCVKSYKESFKYTQDNFIKTFTETLLTIIAKNYDM